MKKFMTPAVTIFDENQNIHLEGNKKVYNHLIEGGIDGIVVLGSTGEFFNLTMEEHKKLIDCAVETIKGKAKLLIGTARMRVDETIELSEYAHKRGVDGVMVISPYYFTLSNEDLERYYNEVAEGTNASIYLYNFPDRTGYDLSPEITLNLCRKHKNIVGYKDTVVEMGHTRKLIETIIPEFPEFQIYSGFDEFFLSNVISGGAGCIGGLSNLYPKKFSEWSKTVREKDYEKAFEIQKEVNKMMELYEVSNPFIPTMKKAMILNGVEIDENCTTPFSKVNEEQTERIKNIMKKFKG